MISVSPQLVSPFHVWVSFIFVLNARAVSRVIVSNIFPNFEEKNPFKKIQVPE